MLCVDMGFVSDRFGGFSKGRKGYSEWPNILSDLDRMKLGDACIFFNLFQY